MADRPNQRPRDPEFPTDEPGAARESREPASLDDVRPEETREPAPGGTSPGGPGLGERLEPREAVGAPGVSPAQPWGEPSPTRRGLEEPAPGRQGLGLGDQAPTSSGAGAFGTETPASTAAGAPGTGEPAESRGGEGVLDSMKDALRKVKDAVIPDDEGREEEARRGPPPPRDRQEPRGPLPQEPQEGRGGGLR